MAYASIEDVETRIGRSLDATEKGRVRALLTDVSAEVDVTFSTCLATLTATGLTFLTAAVCRSVIDLMESPTGSIQSVRLGDASTTYTPRATRGGLRSDDYDTLRRMCGQGGAGIVSVPLQSSSWDRTVDEEEA